jgi:predicted acyl esterase
VDSNPRSPSTVSSVRARSEAEDGCDALGWLQRQALVQRPCRHLRAVLCGPHAGRARLPRPAGTDGAVPRLRRLLQRLPQRHPPGGALDLKQATWAYRNALADARHPEVKAALAALDIRAWFRRMRWRRGDSPISAAPEYEDYLFEQWSHGIFDDYWRLPGIYAEGFYDRYADVPIVHLSGWYDPHARTAMENYVGLSRAKRSRMQLILGPWTHGNRSLSHAGEVEFGPAAPVDGNLAEDFFELRRRLFDRWIKGLANAARQSAGEPKRRGLGASQARRLGDAIDPATLLFG